MLLPGGICCCIYAGSGLEVLYVDDDDGDDGDDNDCSHGDGDDDGDDDGGDGGVDDGDGAKTLNGKQAMVKQVYIPSLPSLHPKASKIPIFINPRNGGLISYVQSLQVLRNPKPSTSSAKNL